jgi:hypothetical protein
MFFRKRLCIWKGVGIIMKNNENLPWESTSQRQAAILLSSGINLLFQASKLEPWLYEPIVKAVSTLRNSVRGFPDLNAEEEDVHDLTAIINRIVTHLTRDQKDDSKYLLKQIQKYHKDEHALEALQAIGRHFYGILTEEDKRQLPGTLKKDPFYIQIILNEAKAKLSIHNLDEAEKLILELLSKDALSQLEQSSEY